jgi:anti-sigma B factor antagonist
MTSPTQLEIREVGDVTVVRFLRPHLTGISEIEELGKRLYHLADDENRTKLVIDLSLVDILPSAALGKLISLGNKVKARGGAMRLCNIQPHVLRLFHLCNLDHVFDVRADEAAALASF